MNEMQTFANMPYVFALYISILQIICSTDAVSMWDLDNGTLLSVFTPDSKIQTISLLGPDNGTLLLGFSDMFTLITMTVSQQNAHTKSSTACGKDLFGESSSSEDDEETNKN